MYLEGKYIRKTYLSSNWIVEKSIVMLSFLLQPSVLQKDIGKLYNQIVFTKFVPNLPNEFSDSNQKIQ